jgi:pyridoxamine 5'-phosphate oxidase
VSTFAESLPDDPLPLAASWIEQAEAAATRRNPTAMALATADPDGRPAVRMVLLRALCAADGFAVFYTNYESRKGRQIARNARAAGVLYWEDAGRQLRIEGPVVRSPARESDAYFRTRPAASQLSAWASEQSRPLEDPAELRRKVERLAAELERTPTSAAAGGDSGFARPPYWGGFRLWIDALELWVEGRDRLHERIRYERRLTERGDGRFDAGVWSHQRLQP